MVLDVVPDWVLDLGLVLDAFGGVLVGGSGVLVAEGRGMNGIVRVMVPWQRLVRRSVLWGWHVMLLLLLLLLLLVGVTRAETLVSLFLLSVSSGTGRELVCGKRGWS